MLVTSKRVIILVLLIGFCLPACALSSAAAPRRYFVAGSEQMLWLTVAQWDQKPEDLVNQFFYRERDSDRVRASHAIPPQLQEIRACAVSGQTLDVFFVDGAHYRYDLRRKWRAHALPGQALPHALAGEQRGSQPRSRTHGHRLLRPRDVRLGRSGSRRHSRPSAQVSLLGALLTVHRSGRARRWTTSRADVIAGGTPIADLFDLS